MRSSFATIAAVLSVSLVTLSQLPVVSAAPALSQTEVSPVAFSGDGNGRIPMKVYKRLEKDIDFNALAASDYGYSSGDTGVATSNTGAAAEPGSAPDSWDVALNMNPNDLPLLNNQAATTTTAADAAATETTSGTTGTESPTEQIQVGAPTDINLDGETTATTTASAIEIGAPTDVNIDDGTTSTTTTTSTYTTEYATPTNDGNNNGGTFDNGEFECLEVFEDCNLQCKVVTSIDEGQFNCIEDVDFGKDFVCTDSNGEEFDCEPIDGQTAGGSGGDGSSTDPSYGSSDGADSDAAGLSSGATASWTSGVLKTGFITAFVFVASAAFLL